MQKAKQKRHHRIRKVSCNDVESCLMYQLELSLSERNNMREFEFYLNAWVFCFRNQVPIDRITRKSWKTWEVEL